MKWSRPAPAACAARASPLVVAGRTTRAARYAPLSTRAFSGDKTSLAVTMSSKPKADSGSR